MSRPKPGTPRRGPQPPSGWDRTPRVRTRARQTGSRGPRWLHSRHRGGPRPSLSLEEKDRPSPILAPRWTLCRRGTSARSPAASVQPEPLPAERPPQAPPPPAHLPQQAQHLEEGVVATPCPQPGVSSSVPVPDPAGLSMDTGEALTPVTPNTCQPAVHSPGPRCGFSPTCPSRSPASLRGPGELAPWEAQLPPPVRPRAQRVPRGPHLRPPGRCGL